MEISVLIAGGGAAGMLAAFAAREAARRQGLPDRSFPVVILERNDSPGAKIRISGGGRCNLTHAGEPAELLAEGFLRKEEQRFLRPAFYAFTGKNLLDILDRHGLECAARPDGKIFPGGGKAAPDVVHAFVRMLHESDVTVETSCAISAVDFRDGFFAVTAGGRIFTSRTFILSTGGVSWPSTGSTGDGLRFAREFGHTLIRPSPALAPVITCLKPPVELAGVSLRSVAFIASAGGKQVRRKGDLLFTHRGLSGPAVLSLSRDIAELFRLTGNCDLFVDLFPGQRSGELQEMLLVQARTNGSRLVRKFLQICPIAPPEPSLSEAPNGTLPSALVPFIMRRCSFPDDLQLSGLSREMRMSLLQALKCFPVGSVKAVPLDQGEISAGGVSLKEVNPKTMQSRIQPGLFFCGEILDYAGEIGGFNLQAAFSTGWLAGREAVAGRW